MQQEKEHSKNLVIELEKIRTPRILLAKKDPNTDLIICLLEKSEYLGVESVLSFYYLDSEGFETLIGIGYVKDIRVSDGKIQAMLHKPESSYQDILDKLGNNDNNVIKNTFVKPTIPNSFLR